MEQVNVILILAGVGERFWPLSNKHFTSFLGKPLVAHTLDNLTHAGFTRITMVVNEENRARTEALVKDYPKSEITIVVQEKGKGMGAAIEAANDHIDGPTLVLAPHDIVDESLFSTIANTIKEDSESFVVAKKMDTYFPGGYLSVDGEYVKDIIEKPGEGKEPSNLVALVLYYFNDGKQVANKIKQVEYTNDDQFEQAISALIKEGLPLRPLIYEGFWGYLKYPWHILDIMDHYLSKIPNANVHTKSIHPSAILTGPIEIEEDVTIHAGAVITGPVYIGKGTIIGNNTLVRHAHIGQHCVVGFGSEVARSYVGDGSWFHTNYVGDSVIGENVSMGAGGVLANLRLDEGDIPSMVKQERIKSGKNKLGTITGNNVRIGVNASIMPGIKIGSNSVVGPGMVVYEDVPDNMAYTMNDGKPQLVENKIDIKALKR